MFTSEKKASCLDDDDSDEDDMDGDADQRMSVLAGLIAATGRMKGESRLPICELFQKNKCGLTTCACAHPGVRDKCETQFCRVPGKIAKVVWCHSHVMFYHTLSFPSGDPHCVPLRDPHSLHVLPIAPLFASLLFTYDFTLTTHSSLTSFSHIPAQHSCYTLFNFLPTTTLL
jgi:hypothetical protein